MASYFLLFKASNHLISLTSFQAQTEFGIKTGVLLNETDKSKSYQKIKDEKQAQYHGISRQI